MIPLIPDLDPSGLDNEEIAIILDINEKVPFVEPVTEKPAVLLVQEPVVEEKIGETDEAAAMFVEKRPEAFEVVTVASEIDRH